MRVVQTWPPGVCFVAASLLLHACATEKGGEVILDAGNRDGEAQADSSGRRDSATVDASVDASFPDHEDEASQLGANPKSIYLYRTYRTDTGSGRSVDYISDGTASMTMTPEGAVRVYDRGAMLSDFWSTHFAAAASDSDVASAALTDFQPTIGWTIEAWFRADQQEGLRPILSDGDDDTYALVLVDGQIEGRATTNDGVTLSARAPVAIDANWQHATVVARIENQALSLRVYLNQRQVAEARLAATALAMPSARPTLGAMKGSHFDGDIHAVEMSNWPLRHSIVATRQLRDGSRMLGRGSYHNYLTNDDGYTLRLERTLNNFDDALQTHTRLQVPLLNDAFVSQGLAVSQDGSRLYLGYYHRLPASNQCSVDQHDSVVVEVDLSTYNVLRILRLSGQMHHVGGLAVFGDNLYAADSTDGELERYSLKTTARHSLIFEGDATHHMPPVIGIEPEQTLAIPITASTLDFDAEAMGLWVGEHRPSSGDAIRSGELRLFGINEEGELMSERAGNRYCLPVIRLQGLAAHYVDGTLRFYLTRSYGNAPSYVYDWEPGAPVTRACADSDIKDIDFALELPPGVEEIDVDDAGNVWTWSESGARYYQKRNHESCSAAWTSLAPYVFGFDANRLP